MKESVRTHIILSDFVTKSLIAFARVCHIQFDLCYNFELIRKETVTTEQSVLYAWQHGHSLYQGAKSNRPHESILVDYQ